MRKYGAQPYKVVVIHGGPGAAGEMAPVALALFRRMGILEPLQTENTIDGQISELKYSLEKHADLPVVLIGFSWGAWLSFIFTSKYPELVRKLILVSSGPFEQKYADKIMETRLSRLGEKDKSEVVSIIESIERSESKNQNLLFAKIGKLLSKADTYEPLECPDEKIDYRYGIFQNVWKQAEQLRKSGKLLELAKNIQCPVIAINGDYDPHPAEGVQKPLSALLKDFRFILLPKCGHKPWIEKNAKKEFYTILEKEIG
jgi:pimeloyl-ACP methyl ester carboxylesterase